LEHLQKNPLWAKIPVIIISSMDITQDMRANLAPRVQAILKKGQVNREELAELIRPAIQSSLLAGS
jgi:CheY-like chemotaxis protein